jgi:hypothetical protein
MKNTNYNTYVLTTETLVNDVGQSKHDEHHLTYSITKNFQCSEITRKNLSWGDCKKSLIEKGCKVSEKRQIEAIYPVLSDGENRNKNLIRERTLLVLDFDDNGEIDEILKTLKQYVYIAWTTHSHQLSSVDASAKQNLNRYRVMIPLSKGVSAAEWESDYKLRLINWSGNLWHGNNAVDNSCFNIGQLGLAPAINIDNGSCQIWVNDGVDTDFIDLNSLPVANSISKTNTKTVRPTVVKDKSTSLSKWQPNAEGISKVVSLLLEKPIIKGISASHFTDPSSKINRFYIACGLISIGAQYSDFLELDAVMKKADSNQTSEAIWNRANNYGGRHEGLILRLLGDSGRLIAGYNPSKHIQINYSTEWDEKFTTQYLTREMVGNKGKVLMKADMGVGKNYLWTNLPLDAGYRIIVFTPLRNIVNQQGSENCIKSGSDRTFTYDQAKHIDGLVSSGSIITENTTLVIDECHNLLLADYRHEALANLETVVNKYQWAQTVFQSATITPDTFEGYINFDRKIEVEKQNRSTAYYQPIHAKSPNQIIATIEKLVTEKPGKKLILWNNKEKLVEVSNALKKQGYISEIVNAKTCRSQRHEAYNLATDVNYMMNDVDVLLGTTSIVEGINIQDDIDDVIVIVVGQEHWQYVKQLSGRFRKASNIYTYHFADYRNPVLWGKEGKDAWVESCQNLMKLKTKIIKVLNDTGKYNHYDFHGARSKEWGDVFKFCGVAFDSESNKYISHNLEALWHSADIEKKEMYSAIDNALNKMLQHGYQLMPFDKMIDQTTLDDSERQLRNSERAARKNRRRINLMQILYNDLNQAIKELNLRDLSVDYVNLYECFKSLGIDMCSDLFQEMDDIIRIKLKLNPGDIDAVKTAVKAWVDGSLTSKSIDTYHKASVKDGVISDLRAKYTVGDILSTNDQRQILSEVVTQMMDQVLLVKNISKGTAFENVMTNQIFVRLKPSFELRDNRVVVDMAKPMTLLKHFLPIESKIVTIEGKKTRVAVVK